jgi:hypothetical protein
MNLKSLSKSGLLLGMLLPALCSFSVAKGMEKQVRIYQEDLNTSTWNETGDVNSNEGCTYARIVGEDLYTRRNNFKKILLAHKDLKSFKSYNISPGECAQCTIGIISAGWMLNNYRQGAHFSSYIIPGIIGFLDILYYFTVHRQQKPNAGIQTKQQNLIDTVEANIEKDTDDRTDTGQKL